MDEFGKDNRRDRGLQRLSRGPNTFNKDPGGVNKEQSGIKEETSGVNKGLGSFKKRLKSLNKGLLGSVTLAVAVALLFLAAASPSFLSAAALKKDDLIDIRMRDGSAQARVLDADKEMR